MKALDFIEDFIYKSPSWKLVSVILIATLFKTGIWYIPNLDASQLIAQNPFVNPFEDPNAHYLFWSWFGPFLAWFIGANGKWSFFFFHLFFSIAFTALFVRYVFKRFYDREARTSLILFSVIPVSATAYFWVSTDSITLFLMLLALAMPTNLVAVLLIGFCLGMQHFEQAFFGAGGVLFALLLSKYCNKDRYDYSINWAFVLLIGVIFGKIFLVCLFEYYDVTVNSGRSYWLKEHFSMLFYQFFFHFHYIIWSIFGIGWIVALKYIDQGKKAIPFFASLCSLMLLLPISGDQTRVLAIITFMLVAVYWLFNQELLAKINNQLVSMVFLFWLITPWGWCWGGVPKWSVFPYDVAYILHRFLGWFNVPANPALWPF